MNKEQFYRKDFETFKPKYYLFCRDCISNFPQKVNTEYLKQTENRNKVITIKEN